MEAYGLQLSELAIQDLVQIEDYIASNLRSSIDASYFITEFLDKLELLKFSPKLGVCAKEKFKVPLDEKIAYRILFIDPYLAIHYIEDNDLVITVSRIFHQKQEYNKLF